MKNDFERAIAKAKDNLERDLARRINDEYRMAKALVRDSLKRGYSVTVFDGEEETVQKSKNKAEILQALFSVDDEYIILHNKEGVKVAWFRMIYGNDGFDVVSDFSNNAIGKAIWHETLSPLADKIERGD